MDKFSALRISLKTNVEVQGRLIIIGKPIVDISKDSKLIIGKEVTLNSRNRGYHINMHSPVKLFADRPGALIKIGNNTRIHGTCIHAYNSITIGKNCLIAANCQIIDGNGHELSFSDVDKRIHTQGGSKPVVIEDSVWLGANTIILPGVNIGRGSVISANSVVTKDIPPMALAGGNPAVVLKQYEQENAI
jgi:acetyltransferase-like isoleucine patch superfamily enzyme